MSVARPLYAGVMRSIHRVALGALLSTVVSSQAFDAVAQSNEALELEWHGPPSCPQQSEVTEQIRVILGAAPGVTLPSGLYARGVIEPIDGRFQLTLTVRVGQTDRSRIIASDDCGSLGKAAAVVLGLLIRRAHESGRELSDSDLGGDFEPSGVPREPTTVKTSPEPSPPQERVVPLPPPDGANQRQWQLLVMAPMITVDYLTLPTVGYGIGVAAGVAHGGWRGFVAGTVWSAQHETRGGVEPYEATFARKSFEVWGCPGSRAGSFELTLCALAAVDVVSASASGDRFTTKQRRIPLVSAGAGLVGFWNMSRQVHLFVSTTGRIMVYRSDFVVEGMMGASNAHTVPWGSLVTSIGTELVF